MLIILECLRLAPCRPSVLSSTLQKKVFTALTHLVGRVNKHEVPLWFSLMALKEEPGASVALRPSLS